MSFSIRNVLQHEETLTQKQAAKYLGVAPGTLWRWARTNKGPRFTRFGKCTIKYKKTDLDKFINENTMVFDPKRSPVHE